MNYTELSESQVYLCAEGAKAQQNDCVRDESLELHLNIKRYISTESIKETN